MNINIINNKIDSIKSHYDELSVISKASIWFILVTIIDRGISLLTQPIINRILSIAEVGSYNEYHSWDAIIVVIASFNLFAGILEVLITKEKDDSKQVVASLCTLSLLITITFFSILFVFINQTSAFLHLKPSYLIIMFLTTASTTIYSFWAVPKRFNYEYKIFSIVGVSLFFTKSVLSVLFSFLFINDRVFGRLLGLCLPNVLAAFIFLKFIYSKVCFSNITKYWKRALLFNLPLIPHYLSQVLLSSSDRIMISRFDINGESSTGLYSVAYSLASLSLIVFAAINNAYQPFAYKAIKEKNYEELRSKTNAVILVSVLFASILSLFSYEGLIVLGGYKYLDAVDIVPVLVGGVFFSSFYYIFSNVEFIYEKTKLIFPITILGALINIALNYLLLPIYGYRIAAYTTLIGYVIIAACHYFVSYWILKQNIYNMKLLLVYIGVLVFVCVLSIVLFSLPSWIRWVIIALLCVITLRIAFKYKLFSKKI